jgi:hypothetical protein
MAEEEWEKREEKTKQDIDKFFFVYGCHPTSEDWRKEFLQFGVGQLEERLAELQSICERVWRDQGGPEKTAKLFREISKRVIHPQINAGLGFVTSLFEVAGLRREKALFAFHVTGEKWAPHEATLRKKWQRRLSIEEVRQKLAERKASAHRPRGIPARAHFVAELIRELRDVRGRIRDNDSYHTVWKEYPEYNVFKITEKHRDLRHELIYPSKGRRIEGLALDFAARKFGIKRSVIDKDWSVHKPPEFRRQAKHSPPP